MSHDIPNLGVIDGSVFVTSGSVNPTATITAIALRAARHLAENRASVPRAGPHRAGGLHGGPCPARARTGDPRRNRSTRRRRPLAALGDALIPPVDDLRGGGSIAATVAGKVLASRPMSPPRSPARWLTRRSAAPISLPAAIRRRGWRCSPPSPAATPRDPGVRARIGFAGAEPRPVKPDEALPAMARRRAARPPAGRHSLTPTRERHPAHGASDPEQRHHPRWRQPGAARRPRHRWRAHRIGGRGPGRATDG